MKITIIVIIILVLIGVGVLCYAAFFRSEAPANFRMAQVERGEMLPTIEATGTVEPEQVVDIGSQVNGLITELKADYGSNVEAGTVLAMIDQTLYQATVDQNLAMVNSASANLALAKANSDLANQNLARDELLRKTNGALAPNQYDTDRAACEVAKAQIGVQQAAIKQAQAALRQAQINLGYCDIKSPVKGTIVDRRVNVGQTVVSSLSASSLFLLAKDLSKIQVWASVNEADIGRVHPGMKVHFTVDAYPNRTFEGEVLQIRLNATMTQNVVTYTVVVITNNDDRKLLPYMTASLKFEIERHENVLKVPNAALRWKPRPKQIAADVREETLKAMNGGGRSKHGEGKRAKESGERTTDAAEGSSPATAANSATGLAPEHWKARADQHGGAPGTPGRAASAQATKLSGRGRQPPGEPISAEAAAALKEHHESSRLWVVDGNFVRPVAVRIIATDGTMTEVRGRDLTEGMDVVIGENVATDADSEGTNPFMPRLPGRNVNKKDSGSPAAK